MRLDLCQNDPLAQEIISQVLNSQVTNFLIYKLTLPLMSFSVYEENLFKTNLTDYLFAEKYAKNEPLLRVKSSGYDLVDTVLKHNYQEYLNFIKFTENCFKSQPADSRFQHGLLFILENFESRHFLLTSPLNLFSEESFQEVQSNFNMNKPQFENYFKTMILEGVIFPGLSSPETYIRAKTCSLVGQLDRAVYTSPQHLVDLCRLVCHALQEANEVTRITAIKALEYLVGQPECLPILKPSLPSIIAKILEMLKLANIDDVVKSLYQIVKQYNDDLLDCAFEISNSVLTTFYECLESSTPDVDDADCEKDSSKDTIEISILTLNEILLLNLPDQFYIDSTAWAMDLVSKVMLMPHLRSLVDPAFKLFNSLIFNLKTLKEEIWAFFPLVAYVMLEQSPKVDPQVARQFPQPLPALLTQVDYGALNIDIPNYNRFLGIFGMFMQHSNGNIVNRSDPAQTPFLQLLFMCLEKLKTQGTEEPDGLQLIVLCKLLIFLIENCYTEIKSVQGVRESMFQHLLFVFNLKERSDALKVNALQLMCVWLFVDSYDFVQLAKAQNCTNDVFYLLFGSLDLFESHNQREDLLFGITGILALPQAVFPEVLPVSSLAREAYTSVKIICNHRVQQLEGEHQTNAPMINSNESPNHQNNEEELLLDDDDEDDDDWNEETLFEDEILYEYESPLFKTDPVVAFKSVLMSMEQNEPPRFQKIITQLSPSERSELLKMYGFADEYHKNKSKS